MREPVSRPNYIAWQEERCMKRKLIFVINLLVSGSPQLEYSVRSITMERGSQQGVEQEPRYDSVPTLGCQSYRSEKDPTKKSSNVTSGTLSTTESIVDVLTRYVVSGTLA